MKTNPRRRPAHPGGTRGFPAVLLRTAALVAVALAMHSCGSESSTPPGGGSRPAQTRPSSRPRTRPAPPARIVSLAPNITEILFALGVGDRVVGVTEWCDYPPQARTRPKVGGYIDFSLERVVGLRPDLVIGAHGIPLERLHRLEELGIPVVAENPTTFAEVMEQIERLGWVVGARERAREIVARMRRDIREVTGRVENLPPERRPRVMYGSWEAPVFLAGPGTFIDEAIRLAGGVNIAADAGKPWPVGYSIEKIVAHDPQIIVRGYNPTKGLSMGERARTIEQLRNDPVWGTITAVRTGRVCWVDENLLVRPGPRLTQGLKVLARCIHPELFPPAEGRP